MKILYAIQGTGNGHLSRALDIVPALSKYCDLDILISGEHADVEFPFEVKYKLKGLSFIYGKKGGIDMWNTYVEANTKNLRKEINFLPVEEYDFVVNDFEPVSAWACYKKKVPCISLSHQSAVADKSAPKPKKKDLLGMFILKNYAPSNIQFGFHFSRYGANINTPVIRQEIRNAKITDEGHYTVYLPAYSDEKLVKLLSQIKGVNKWHIFSKHTKCSLDFGSIEINPITNVNYIESLRTCSGLLCGAGFEAPAEAIHLAKKLMVIPIRSQFEQKCNAAALKELGVPVLKKLNKESVIKIQNWVDSDYKLTIDYPDNTNQIIKHIFETHVDGLLKKNNWSKEYSLTYGNDDNVSESKQIVNPEQVL